MVTGIDISHPPTCNVFEIDFYAGSFVGAGELVVKRARSGAGGYATLTGAHGVVEAQHDSKFKRALDAAWVNFPDGVPVTWAQKRLRGATAERVCGIDLLPHVVKEYAAVGLTHYLFGSTDKVLENLRDRLMTIAPDVIIVGVESPPFGPIHEQDGGPSVQRIREAAPDIVWVGLGAPKQELWMRRNAAALAPAVVVGVGAAFDIVAGIQPRAPLAMQEHGLEWLYRLVREPRRLSGRYIRANSEFLVRFAREIEKTRRGSGRGIPGS